MNQPAPLPRAGFADHCAELLAPLGTVRCTRMFGGWGLYVDEVFVAILLRDRLYLKADGTTRKRFEAEGGERFGYVRQGKPQGLDFWSVPAEAMDSPALMAPWGRLALEAALRARAAKAKRSAR